MSTFFSRQRRQASSDRPSGDPGPSSARSIDLGVKILYEPLTPKDAVVDIVFVHGLTGSSSKTWLEKQTRTHWPTHLLSVDICNSRILLFGYDADVVNFWSPASQNRIGNHAQNMLGDLTRLREETDTETRKLAFVTHSLGGLVTQNCLSLSWRQAEQHLNNIASYTVGIIFLGTPHHGADHAAWAKVCTTILGIVRPSNSNLLTALRPDSEVLTLIQSDFHQLLRLRQRQNSEIEVTCFFEELPIPGIGKVVEQNSAILTSFSSYSIHANHMDMARFSSRDDQGYSSIVGELRRWVKKIQRTDVASNAVALRHSADQGPKLDDREVECLRALYTTRYEEHKDGVPLRAEGTCEWFLASHQYRAWLENQLPEVLWITADPGCGKSVLANSLVEKELHKSKAGMVCYFFFRNDVPDQSNALGALCAILHQLFSQNELLLKHAMTDFLQVGGALSQNHRRLWDILIRSARDAASGEIICVLDALDECEEAGVKRLIQLMAEFYSGPISNRATTRNLKFLITSRPYLCLERQMSRMKQSIGSIHASGSAAITAEINQYIKDETKTIGHELRLPDPVRQGLEDKLMGTENQTYLWIHLIMDEIRQSIGVSQLHGLQRIIETLPLSVYNAYENILRRASDPQRAIKLLRIVMCSRRPLTVGELNHALAMEDSQALEPGEDDSHFKWTIRSQCGLFITIAESERVFLIHRTAKTFLQTNAFASARGNSPSFSKSWGLPWDERDSHQLLAKTCITYLSTGSWFEKLSEDERNSPVLIQSESVPFLHYAAINWSSHVLAGYEEQLHFETLRLLSQSQRIDFLFRLLWLDETGWSYWTSEYRAPSHTPAVLAASFLGFVRSTSALAKNRTALMSRSSGGASALHWAVWKDRRSIVQLLIEAGLDPKGKDDEGNTSLHIVALKGHIVLLGMLLDHCVNIDEQNKAGNTPLHIAAANGHNEVVELLLQQGADTSIIDLQRKNVLHHAIDNERFGINIETVRILMKHSVLGQEPDIDNMTPLHLAVQCNLDDVAGLLLDYNFSIDVPIERKVWLARVENGSTSYTLHESHDRVFRQDDSHAGYTPLHAAALFGNPGMIKLLLRRGADPNVQGERGETPLHLALRHRMGKPKIEDAWTNAGNSVEGALDMIVDDLDDDNTKAYDYVHNMREETIMTLLDTPEINLSVQDNSGDTCLHAIQYSDGDESKYVAKLLQKGMDLNNRNHRGETAVHLAARGADHNSLKVFLQYQADPLKIDDLGQNVLHHACASRQPSGREQTILTLLGHSAAPALISSIDSQGRNCLHHSVSRLPDVNIVQLLLDRGVDINHIDSLGRSPLITAIDSGPLSFPSDTICVLIEAGADPHVIDKAGRKLPYLLFSGLSCAAAAILDQLATHDVKMDAVDLKGRTILHHAAIAGALDQPLLRDIVEKWRVDVNFRDSDDKTALDHAVLESGRPHHPHIFDGDRWCRARGLLREFGAHETSS